jgi:hypothetical protein
MKNSYFYISTTSILDASGTCYFGSTSGRTGTPPTFTGFELASSLLRGHLIAATQGLSWLRNTQPADNRSVDLLIPDATTAATVRTRKPGRSILHGDADEHWAAYHQAAEGFTVRVIESPAQSAILSAFWNWHANPQIPTHTPDGESAGYTPTVVKPAPLPLATQPFANYVAKNYLPSGH